MGTTTTINERSRVSLSLGAAWSLVGGLVSVVLAIGYAASEMKQMRQSFDDLAAQLKQNNAALVQIDKRLPAFLVCQPRRPPWASPQICPSASPCRIRASTRPTGSLMRRSKS